MRVRLLPLGLLCALAVAACGSSGSGGSGAGSASTPGGSATVTRTVTRTSSGSSTASASASSSSTTTPTTSTTGSSTSASGTANAQGTGTAACVASDLALTSLGGSGATGHLLLAFGLRNSSAHACRTGGYPGVLFLDASGGALRTVPDHTTSDFFGHTVLRELTLAPGELASFRLGVVDVGSGGSGAGCERAAALQVIPPNDTHTLRITRQIFECGGRVSVSPLQSGTDALH